MVSFGSKAELLPIGEIIERYKESPILKRVITLNRSLSSLNIKTCPSVKDLKTCLRPGHNETYLIYLDSFEAEKMQYTVPPDGSGVSAIATIALNKSSEIALFELVAEKAKILLMKDGPFALVEVVMIIQLEGYVLNDNRV